MPGATPQTARRRKTKTALDILKDDHAEAKKLFKRFERSKKSGDSAGMRQVAQAACRALGIHAQIEEEIFYPALRESADASDALDEADVEHSHIKELVGQLEVSSQGMISSRRDSRFWRNTSSTMYSRKKVRYFSRRGRRIAIS